MSNELATIGDKLTWAGELAKSGMLPAQYRGNPANLLWAIEMGQSLGLTPMQAVTGIHVIEGKPTASAGLIGSLVRSAGHRLRVHGTDQQATAQIWRRDDPDFCFESVWTLDRARTAGLLGKGVWKTYPAAMLQARAITEVARQACPEALSGVQYTAEELGDDDRRVSQAVVVQSAPPESRVAQRIAALATPPPAQAPQEALPAAAPVVEALAPPAVGWLDDADRKAFMAHCGSFVCEDGKRCTYDEIAAWCESLGRPRPSGMTVEQRRKLAEALESDVPWGKFTAWRAARQQAPVDPPAAVADDDRGFFDEPAPAVPAQGSDQ